MKNNSSLEPKLDAPGKGLPFPDRYILKILAPFKSKMTPWWESATIYNKCSEKIISLIESDQLTAEKLNRRILVSPTRGLEDSSRFWSLGMTIDHLLITNQAFKHIILELGKGVVPPIEVRIEKVKPPEVEHTQEVLVKFKIMSQKQVDEIEKNIVNRKSNATLRHPWFGNFTAHQWFWIMAVHQGIHLQQIKKIVTN